MSSLEGSPLLQLALVGASVLGCGILVADFWVKSITKKEQQEPHEEVTKKEAKLDAQLELMRKEMRELVSTALKMKLSRSVEETVVEQTEGAITERETTEFIESFAISSGNKNKPVVSAAAEVDNSEVLASLREDWTDLKYGVPGWVPHEIRGQVDLHPSREGLSKSTLVALEKMMSLAEECNSLACDFDEWSVKNKAPSSENIKADKPDAKPDMLALLHTRRAVSAEWAVVRRLYYCVDEHLRNAILYHQFYQDVDGVWEELTTVNFKMQQFLKQDRKDMEKNYRTTLTTLAEILANLLLINAAVSVLSDKSRKIVPVQKRVEKLKDPLIVTSLCTYKSGKVTISEGEPMLLVDNSDKDKWKVKNARGEVSEVRAVMVLIPPPDKSAIQLANDLQDAVTKSWTDNESEFGTLLIEMTNLWLQEETDMEFQFETVLKSRKEDFLKAIVQFKEVSTEYLADEDEFSKFVELVNMLEECIESSEDIGKEDKRLDGTHEKAKKLDDSFSLFKALRSLFGPPGNPGQWKVVETSMGVEIKRQSMTAESSMLSAAHGEVQQTFSIQAVLDPRNNTEISMVKAVELGIIDNQQGLYVNPVNGMKIPIPEAMSTGFIMVETTTTKKSKEVSNSIGLMKITEVKETRPYTILNVIDPTDDSVLSISEAIEKRVFDKENKLYLNPSTHESMTLDDAIQCGGLVVEFEGLEEQEDPEIITHTYAIYAVTDTTSGTRLTYDEAVGNGIINEDTGEYFDKRANSNMFVKDAIKRGFIKARIVSDPKETQSLNASGKKISVFSSPEQLLHVRSDSNFSRSNSTHSYDSD